MLGAPARQHLKSLQSIRDEGNCSCSCRLGNTSEVCSPSAMRGNVLVPVDSGKCGIKLFHRQVEHGISQENVSEIDHFSKQKRADTEARTFQYTVCEQSFPEKECKRHIRTNPGEKSIP
ncbi:hypothetical protein TNCV_1475531 [Trichonephila clavipes]|nr:hypothetical protein TNCV_1475531 [Trichonephila clavipes]